MSTSISSISSGSSNSAVYNTNSAAKRSKPDPAELFAKADADGNGSLSASELVSISPEGAEAADAEAAAQEALERMDTDDDGEVSQAEFEAAAPPDEPKAQGSRPPPPPPPAASSGSEEEEDSTDPADTNEDGKVSQQERVAYEAKQAAQQVSRAAAEAVQTYEQVAEA